VVRGEGIKMAGGVSKKIRVIGEEIVVGGYGRIWRREV
jgi:hypothetical protein